MLFVYMFWSHLFNCTELFQLYVSGLHGLVVVSGNLDFDESGLYSGCSFLKELFKLIDMQC